MDETLMDEILKELKELVHSDVKIDVMCYIECRKEHHTKRFCAQICSVR